MNTQVATQPNAGVKLIDDIEQRTEGFRGALPAHIPVERFKKVLINAINTNPKLLGADRRTLFMSAMKAATDGLVPDGREGALVIYSTKQKDANGGEHWIDAVQWMPMIAGIRKKVRNSGEIATWDAHVVYEKDEFAYELGDDPFIKHKPALDGDPGKIVAAYSVAVLKSGEKSREVMTVAQIERIRSLSKSKDKGPWKDHYSEMCRKTVARRHSKVLPMSTDLDDLLRRDDALYDMHSAGDKEVKGHAVPPRPQITGFTDVSPPADTDENFDADTGEITDDEPGKEEEAKPAAATKATPEADKKAPTKSDKQQDEGKFDKAEAWQLGVAARDANASLHSIPADIAQMGFGEDWQDGWRARDEEVAEAAKKLRTAKDGE